MCAPGKDLMITSNMYYCCISYLKRPNITFISWSFTIHRNKIKIL